MVRATEVAGFIGAGLAGAAYVPQIWHLIKERCSAGLSRIAFAVWLAASLLVTTHAFAIGAVVFIVLGTIQLAATATILVYTTKYANSYCSSHLPAALVPELVEGATAAPLERNIELTTAPLSERVRVTPAETGADMRRGNGEVQ
jgi:uncharacterized protein with PQ loop repeat